MSDLKRGWIDVESLYDPEEPGYPGARDVEVVLADDYDALKAELEQLRALVMALPVVEGVLGIRITEGYLAESLLKDPPWELAWDVTGNEFRRRCFSEAEAYALLHLLEYRRTMG